ncbi:hypothetical protein AKJ51_04750 [candidate division MSBL1 archaeon SCGC-AAA382A20]|uniref:Uncharacterized protein n=1 Tax=candidate division MSBL1 archaeon SCGC-AAA382A20 TaxID=1698280 RepID=A0A133VHA3_9EURY|nr:hypothetical protein AKJ51_04750 [candidate division MSBL1 archaeon SCGC-AAA382A20]
MGQLKNFVSGLLAAVIVGLQVLLLAAVGDIWIFPEVAARVSRLGANLLVALLPVRGGFAAAPVGIAAPIGLGGIIFLLAIFLSLYTHWKFGL